MFINNYENPLNNSAETSKSAGLSEYSQDLIIKTREIVDKIFPQQNDKDSEMMLNSMSVNRELLRTCLVYLMEKMDSSEKEIFFRNPGTIKDILLLSLEKHFSPENEKKEIAELINSLTEDDIAKQNPMIDKLDLLNLDSPVCKLHETWYKQIRENPEAVEAHAYLNLTEK